MTVKAPIPITLVTGFLGSGKTTLLLSLLPQLLALNPSYKLALLKNEFGDLAIDSQLASSSSISGVRELLNGCICCNLVGEIGPALEELKSSVEGLQRVVVETSGSAWPATLAMEINRLSKGGDWVLDGVVSVIDVENWKGYEDTSYTAKLQARYTDLIVFNKWEGVSEPRFDDCLDKLGDLEGVQVGWVKSDMGKVPVDLVFGIDASLARGLSEKEVDGYGLNGDSHQNGINGHSHHNGINRHDHDHKKGHQSEVEVLSITLRNKNAGEAIVDTEKLEKLLREAPKDEVYRIKAVLTAATPIPGSDQDVIVTNTSKGTSRYILNWAFGRWTCTPMAAAEEHESSNGTALRMTMILARYESKKWKKKIETRGFVELVGEDRGILEIDKVG